MNYNSMTKLELEEYGRTIGIELDRRKNKKTLINELKQAQKKNCVMPTPSKQKSNNQKSIIGRIRELFGL